MRHINIKYKLKKNSQNIKNFLTIYYHQAKLSNTLLISMGGLSRNMQYPYSDVDIALIYFDNSELINIENFIQICWDNKIKVSCLSVSYDKFLVSITKDWSYTTSFLHAKLIKGNKNKFWILYVQYRKWLKLNLYNFISVKDQELFTRYKQYPLYSLEPNSKLGCGASRDLDYISWVLKASNIPNSPIFLHKYLKISKHELKEFRKQATFISSVRYELQLYSGKNNNIILFSYQQTLAKHFNYNDANRTSQEQFMYTYFRITRALKQFNKQFQILLHQKIYIRQNYSVQLQQKNFYSIKNNFIEVSDENFFIRHPQKIFAVFALLDYYDDFSLITQRAIFKAKNVLSETWRNNNYNKNEFLNLFKLHKNVYKIFSQLHEYSILGKFLPNFRQITGQLQYDLVHIYTVDQHTLKVMEYLNSFIDNSQILNVNSNLIYTIAGKIKNFWLLYLVAIFHDLGKGKGGDHSSISAKYIKEFCIAHNISIKKSRLLIWFVENHLLLSYTAQYYDLNQINIIEYFCKKINIYRNKNQLYNLNNNIYKAKLKIKPRLNIENIIRHKNKNRANIYPLTMLYIFTVADINGTNPKAYNSWKASLIDKLFSNCIQYLKNLKKINNNIQKIEQIIQCVNIENKSKAKDFLAKLSDKYLIDNNYEDLAWVVNQICNSLSSVYINIKSKYNWQIWIYRSDIDFLFMSICYVMLVNNIDIMHAYLDNDKNNYAFNCIDINVEKYLKAYGKLSNQQTQILKEQLQTNLLQAIEDTHKFYQKSALINTKNWHIRHNLAFNAKYNAVNILKQNDKFTLHIKTSNYTGLLFNVAHILANNKIAIQRANLNTIGNSVEDTFFICSNNLENYNFRLNLEVQILQVLY